MDSCALGNAAADQGRTTKMILQVSETVKGNWGKGELIVSSSGIPPNQTSGHREPQEGVSRLTLPILSEDERGGALC